MDRILTDTVANDLITSVISIEDLMKYFELRDKVIQAEKLLAEKEYEVNKSLYETNIEENAGPVPFVVKINISTDISQASSDKYKEPKVIEKIHKDYIIDFTAQNYKDLIDEFYSSIQTTLEQSCAKVFKREESDDGNIQSET